MNWEWNAERALRYEQQRAGSAKVRADALAELEGEDFQYLGKLVERRVGEDVQPHEDLLDYEYGDEDDGAVYEDDGAIGIARDQLHEGGAHEGGALQEDNGKPQSKQALLAGARDGFDWRQYVQHPEKRIKRIGEPVADLRIYNLFKHQMLVDFILIRTPIISGCLYCLATDFTATKLNQLEIQAYESIIASFLMMFLQGYIKKTWEDQKLPFKMRDTKANYLFKPLRYPDELAEYQLLKQDKGFMPDWDRYLPHYMLPEIFLDNKLEELLNIFGRRQCKSCIEFATGTELVDDPRRHRSFPLSPRGEALYRGMEHEFNLVDF